jgi:hypothetical protein
MADIGVGSGSPEKSVPPIRVPFEYAAVTVFPRDYGQGRWASVTGNRG